MSIHFICSSLKFPFHLISSFFRRIPTTKRQQATPFLQIAPLLISSHAGSKSPHTRLLTVSTVLHFILRRTDEKKDLLQKGKEREETCISMNLRATVCDSLLV